MQAKNHAKIQIKVMKKASHMLGHAFEFQDM